MFRREISETNRTTPFFTEEMPTSHFFDEIDSSQAAYELFNREDNPQTQLQQHKQQSLPLMEYAKQFGQNARQQGLEPHDYHKKNKSHQWQHPQSDVYTHHGDKANAPGERRHEGCQVYSNNRLLRSAVSDNKKFGVECSVEKRTVSPIAQLINLRNSRASSESKEPAGSEVYIKSIEKKERRNQSRRDSGQKQLKYKNKSSEKQRKNRKEREKDREKQQCPSQAQGSREKQRRMKRRHGHQPAQRESEAMAVESQLKHNNTDRKQNVGRETKQTVAMDVEPQRKTDRQQNSNPGLPNLKGVSLKDILAQRQKGLPQKPAFKNELPTKSLFSRQPKPEVSRQRLETASVAVSFESAQQNKALIKASNKGATDESKRRLQDNKEQSKRDKIQQKGNNNNNSNSSNNNSSSIIFKEQGNPFKSNGFHQEADKAARPISNLTKYYEQTQKMKEEAKQAKLKHKRLKEEIRLLILKMTAISNRLTRLIV